ncbi:cupin domain-containing protein [Streptomyces sp. NPDC005408]|uniref:cupin domain-containing protein n=1 Tax=Streptomyces sp. NPDC005408 TaxID=3155341 RepID=UPI0033A2EAD6
MSDLFDLALHLVDLSGADCKQVVDDHGIKVEGITGVSGARAISAAGVTLGVDRIILDEHSSFPLHTHEGDHLLYVLGGTGAIHINGKEIPLESGQSIFVPAVYPHGLRGPLEGDALQIIAFSTPHHPVDSIERMTVVEESEPYLDGLMLGSGKILG